jgi:dCMP deaminase
MKQKYLLAYMDMLQRFAETSEATRLKVAAMLVKNDAIISIGINGTPPGWESNVCESPEGDTLPWVRHAEIACFDKLRKYESYNSTMFITHSPCVNCAKEIVKALVTKVYYRDVYRCTEGLVYLEKHGIPVEKI